MLQESLRFLRAPCSGRREVEVQSTDGDATTLCYGGCPRERDRVATPLGLTQVASSGLFAIHSSVPVHDIFYTGHLA